MFGVIGLICVLVIMCGFFLSLLSCFMCLFDLVLCCLFCWLIVMLCLLVGFVGCGW